MKYFLKIEVSLKQGHSDPEGETTAQLLKELGYKIANVGISKVYTVTLNADNRKEANQKAQEMCRRLLANPTKDDFTIRVEEEE